MKNRISFIPRPSKILKNERRITFIMRGNFDFSDIANIIKLRIVSLTTKAILNLIVKPYKTSVIFCSKCKSNILLKLKNATTFALSSFAAAKLRFGVQPKGSNINPYITSSKLCINLKTKCEPITQRLTSEASEKYIVRLINRIFFCLNTTMQKMFLIMWLKQNKTNSIELSNDCLKGFLKLKGTPIEQSIQFNSVVSPYLILRIGSDNTDIKLASEAAMKLYRPVFLRDLDGDKLEDWYDKSIKDIFYGYEML